MKVNEEIPLELKFKSKDELIEEIIELKKTIKSNSKFNCIDTENSSELIDLLVNNSHGGLLIINNDFKIEFANERVCELTAFEQNKILNQDFRTLLPPNSKIYASKKYINLIKGIEKEQIFELPVIIKGNENKIFEIRNTTYKTPQNEVKILTHLQDITEKRATEEVIRQSEEKFRTIVDNSHLGIVIIDNKFKFEYVNNRFLNIMHASENNLVGQDFRKFISKDSIDLVIDRYKKRQKNISVPSEYIIKLLRTDGDERIVKLSSTTIEYAGNVKTIAQILDVTEEHRKAKLEKTLLNISQAVNEVKNLPDFLHIVKTELSKILDTTNFYIALYDSNFDTYTFPYHVDEFDSIDDITQIQLKDSLTDYVRRNNKAILVDLKMQEILEKEGEIKGVVGEYSPVWLGAPLAVDNVVVGVIGLQNYHHEDAFTAADLELLKIVSENVSSAIWKTQIIDKLTQSEMQYRDFIARSSEGIYRLDFEKPIDISLPVDEQVQKIIRSASVGECNNMFAKMYGYEVSSQLTGKKLLEFYGNTFENGDKNYRVNANFVKNNYKIINSITEERDSSGNKIYISNNSVGVVKNNHLQHIWGMQDDITEKKRVDDILRQIAEGIPTSMDDSFFKSMLMFLDKTINIDFAIIAKLDTNNEIVVPLACWEENKITDKNEFVVINTPCENVIENGEADYYDNLSKLFPNDELLKQQNYETFMGRALKDSTNKVIGVICLLFKNKIEKPELIKFMLNIFAAKSSAEIERLNYVNELVAAKDEAERSNKLKTDFLAQMSHEIRTPVNTILSFSSLLKESLENQLTNDLQDSFKIIENGGKRLIRTIDLILNVSQLQSGNLVLSPTEQDLITTLNDLVQEFNRSAVKKGLSLTFTGKEKSLIIFADHYTITQIFANLIHNAIKYTNEGSINIEAFKDLNNTISVKITDTGVGMSDGFQANIFDPFSQEETGYTRKFEGTGLGLTLVKKYCELNNAEIIVESKKNEGTTFIVKFK